MQKAEPIQVLSSLSSQDVSLYANGLKVVNMSMPSPDFNILVTGPTLKCMTNKSVKPDKANMRVIQPVIL